MFFNKNLHDKNYHLMLSLASEIQKHGKLHGERIIFNSVRIYIPTQDTLQDILGYTPKLALGYLHDFVANRIFDSYNFSHIHGPWDDTYEKMWLRYLMYARFDKRWDPDKKDWVFSEWDYENKRWKDIERT